MGGPIPDDLVCTAPRPFYRRGMWFEFLAAPAGDSETARGPEIAQLGQRLSRILCTKGEEGPTGRDVRVQSELGPSTTFNLGTRDCQYPRPCQTRSA